MTGRPNKQEKRSFRLALPPMNILGGVLLVATIIFFKSGIHPAIANNATTLGKKCQQSEAIGSIFNNFRNFYIYYAVFPQSKDIEKYPNFYPSYPVSLKFESFNQALLTAIKANFAECLKNEDGSEKSVIVIPPDTPGHIDQRIHDPQDLTLWVKASAAGESGNQARVVNMFFYRPEVVYKNARLPSLYNFYTKVFFLNSGDKEIEKERDSFFEMFIRPSYSRKSPPDEGLFSQLESVAE